MAARLAERAWEQVEEKEVVWNCVQSATFQKWKTRVAQWAEEWHQKPYDSFKFVYTHTLIHPRTATTTSYGNWRCALTPLVDIHCPTNGHVLR